MKKMLTSRQTAMLLFMSIISLKFLVFPALISKYSQKDSYIVVFLFLMIEIMVMFFILMFIKKYPNLTFKEVLTNTFGEVFSKIIYIVLFIYFLFKTLLLTKETHNYFLEAIFDELSWWFFILPLTIFITYVMTKNIKILARTIEILFWFLVVSVGISFVAPLYNIDLLNIFPVFENGVYPIFNAMFYSVFSFGDYLLLILFMGKIKFEKSTVKKIMSYMIFCLIFITIFYIVFVALFNNSGINHILAISDISVRSGYPYSQEKLDWLAILIWTIALLFQIGFYALVTKNCFDEIIKIKNKMIPALIISSVLFVFSMILYLNLELTLKIATSIPFIISALVIQIAIPLILLICFIVLKYKKFEDKNNLKHETTFENNNFEKPSKKNKNSTTKKGGARVWKEIWKRCFVLKLFIFSLPLHC